MYALVADVQSYNDFLPWCGGTRVLSEDECEVTAEVDIAFRNVRQSFTTVNQLEPGRQITMTLKEGPFSRLNGVWKFVPLDAQASKIMFDVEFEFSNRLVGAVIRPVFSMIANGMVDAFHDRAKDLYGVREA
jgi:ribosome-associated toxin RatA of RatAB toxin-antitoxin module